MNWISVKERLPEIDLDVLVFEEYRDIKTIKIGHMTNIEEFLWISDNYIPIDSYSLDGITKRSNLNI